MRGQATVYDNASFANPTFTGTVTGAGKLLAQSAIPFIHISSGSIGNNGALTGITALNLTYSGGAYCYYPANAISASSAAGWYWTVFSSTTAGTIYNSTYTSGMPVAGTLTAFATTGPGAFTGDTTERAGPTIALAGNSLGPNGSLRVDSAWGANSTAGAKVWRWRYGGIGGTAHLALSVTTASLAYSEVRRMANTGTTNSQKNSTAADRAPSAGSANAPTVGAIDSTVAQDIVFTTTKAVATDNSVLEGFQIEVFYGA